MSLNYSEPESTFHLTSESDWHKLLGFLKLPLMFGDSIYKLYIDVWQYPYRQIWTLRKDTLQSNALGSQLQV